MTTISVYIIVVIWAFVICCIKISFASLLDQYKSQPWPLKIDRFTSCCRFLPSTLSLNATKDLNSLKLYAGKVDECVSNVMIEGFCPKEADFYHQKVLIMSLAAEGSGRHKVNDITLFRPFQIGAVGAYAEHHDYKFCSHTALQPSGVDEEDFRWHKVRLMMDALNTYASKVEYLVWIGT